MPMPDKGLNKLSEECGELVQVAMKFSSYPHGNHPDGTNLQKRLSEEIADVLAAIDFVVGKHKIDLKAIMLRKSKKLALFNQWDSEES